MVVGRLGKRNNGDVGDVDNEVHKDSKHGTGATAACRASAAWLPLRMIIKLRNVMNCGSRFVPESLEAHWSSASARLYSWFCLYDNFSIFIFILFTLIYGKHRDSIFFFFVFVFFPGPGFLCTAERVENAQKRRL